MKRRMALLVGISLAAGLLLAACSASAASQGNNQTISWWELTLRAIQQDNFLGYVIPLVIGAVGFTLGWSNKVRFTILGFTMVYLGFYLGLRISGLGAPTTFVIFLDGFRDTIGLRNNWSFYLTWVVLAIVGLTAGRVFCGWVCPMGAVQQFLHRKNGWFVSPGIHRWLRYVRFAVAVVAIVTVAIWSVRFWGPWDPFRTLFRIDATNWYGPYVLMGVVLVASIFVFAPWCRYVCPLGAILSLFSRVSLFKVRLDESKCTDCKRCARLDCQYGAIVAGEKGVKPSISYFDCTSCGECVTKCPEKAFSVSMSSSKTTTEKGKPS